MDSIGYPGEEPVELNIKKLNRSSKIQVYKKPSFKKKEPQLALHVWQYFIYKNSHKKKIEK